MTGYRIDRFPDVDNLEEILDPSFNERGLIDNISINLSKKLNHFWRRWRLEYLVALRERNNQVKGSDHSIKKGEVVLIHEDLTPRAKWRLGLITEVYFGSDGLIRSVGLKTANGTTNRPISKLYPLEVYHEFEELPVDRTPPRPKRLAAAKALESIKKL